MTLSGPETQKKTGLKAIANSSRWHCVFMAASWDVWRPVVSQMILGSQYPDSWPVLSVFGPMARILFLFVKTTCLYF